MNALSSPTTPPYPTIAQPVRDLLRVLRAKGYSCELISRVLGNPGIAATAAGSPEAAVWYATTSEAPSRHKDMVLAFYLRQPCPHSTFSALVGEELTQQLVTDGCLTVVDDQDGDSPHYSCAVDIRPITVAAHGAQDVLIASDPDASLEISIPHTDHVPGVGNAPLSLLNMVPPVDDDARILDLGCGSGVLSLVLGDSATAVEITGTDISPRALEFARANSSVASKRENTFTWRRGSWFEPVTGEKFDMIVANPPFVIGPPRVEHVYRDSGLPLDQATSLVVRNAARYLNDAGTAHILAGWALEPAEDAASRIAQWLPSHGVRAWVVQREEVDIATYVTTWLNDESLDPRSQQGRARAKAWMDFFARNGVTRVGLGFVHLQKIPEEQTTELTFEIMDHPLPEGAYLGAEVGEFFARTAWLDGKNSDEILNECYAIRPTVALERVSLPSADDVSSHGFRDHILRLARTDGPAWTHEVDEPLISVLSGLHPAALPLSDVVDLYCTVHDVDRDVFREALIPLIVDLIRHGMIIPSELISEGVS
ncbi:N5-glutamine methyltransferase family protein [Corynebacterium anserum]|uniref:Methyltransferase n=1 Tax=Corynebacterium anserum TaxID=2684406 RepID=A0A7G7YNN8_9CORY|nr:class I SAM-dependent methyltransferase [Corynebacterium anserum]MBC2681691.1 methyltransferase [Corynebacterium anserum]QNH96108.1 methyltransferase [Corynebacterium anserum]